MELLPWRKPPTKTATLTLRPPRRYRQTAWRSPPTDRRKTKYHPQYHNLPIRHLFRGGFIADKNTVETGHQRENAHLYTPYKESGRHGTRAAHLASPHLLAPLPGA
ncbi:hypothetical protein NDU88_005351 [Pleurodeles waltl]|uniref:Uncharacterized protein n=1 Tax=Pleurodeles waltl TaxID=8319 RepID=A0AAV7VIR5_PLEWA|nr:hypothetical protein NDU88_005351 [Pleurodeles waltl]